MGYRYFASVTFPAVALEFPTVEKWFNNNAWASAEPVYDDDGVVVEDVDASYGEIDITRVLDEICMPYDHYHRDGNGMNEYTVLVRYTMGIRQETNIPASYAIVNEKLQSMIATLTNSGVSSKEFVIDFIKSNMIIVDTGFGEIPTL